MIHWTLDRDMFYLIDLQILHIFSKMCSSKNALMLLQKLKFWKTIPFLVSIGAVRSFERTHICFRAVKYIASTRLCLVQR